MIPKGIKGVLLSRGGGVLIRKKIFEFLHDSDKQTNLAFWTQPVFLGYSGFSRKSDTIGKMPVWGPGFKVSFDFKIEYIRTGPYDYAVSKPSGKCCHWIYSYYNYSSIFTMRSTDYDDYIKTGEGIPAVFVSNTSLLCVTFPLNGNIHKGTCGQKKVALKTWYTLDVSSVMEGSQVSDL